MIAISLLFLYAHEYTHMRAQPHTHVHIFIHTYKHTHTPPDIIPFGSAALLLRQLRLLLFFHVCYLTMAASISYVYISRCRRRIVLRTNTSGRRIRQGLLHQGGDFDQVGKFLVGKFLVGKFAANSTGNRNRRDPARAWPRLLVVR